jgi:hypothetical protein
MPGTGEGRGIEKEDNKITNTTETEVLK